MWANHDWLNIHPASFTNKPEKLTEGEVSAETWEKLTDYVIATYFKQPNYWKIDGKAYFSTYEIGTFVNGFGTAEKAAAALQRFEQKTKAAGFPGLRLNVMAWGFGQDALAGFPWEQALKDPDKLFQAVHPASVTSYCYVHHYTVPAGQFSTMQYAAALNANEKAWGGSARRPTSPTYRWAGTPAPAVSRPTPSPTVATRGCHSLPTTPQPLSSTGCNGLKSTSTRVA